MSRSIFSRRDVLAISGVAGAAALLPGLAHAGIFNEPDPVVSIVDSHIHLFDPNRPGGVPYAGPEKSPTHRAGSFPAGYAQHARPLGIVGAIVVEASPLVEDNQWVLDQAASNPIILGMIGNLRPEHADFPALLARFHANPLFRGIRYGNLWDYDLAARSREPAFLDALKRLAEADLVLETANQNIALLEAALRVSDAVPGLRIVIDHLPAFDPAPAEQRAYQAALRNFAGRPQVACKLSEVIHPIAGAIHADLATYRERLDTLRVTFGEDRVIFGSDYPQSDSVAALPQVVGLAKAAFAGSSAQAREKFFSGNSRRIYKWAPRGKLKAG